MLFDYRRNKQQSGEVMTSSPTMEIYREDVLGHEHFPLKLGRMERYMLWDDLPDYPKRFRVANRFEGTVDERILRIAVSIAVRRHALLLAVPDSKDNPRYWQLPPVCRCDVLWGEGTFHDPPQSIRFDWTSSEEYRGLRIWGRNSEGESEIVFDFHHANCDGLGGRTFVKDFLLAYDTLVESARSNGLPDAGNRTSISSTISWSKIDSKLLVDRDQSRNMLSTNQSRPTNLFEKLINAFKFHAFNPKPMFPNAKRQNTSDNSNRLSQTFSVRLHTFSQEHTARIVKRCEHQNVRLNDLAACLLSKSIIEWNVQQRPESRKDRVRILIPTDLRTIRDRCLPAANRFGFGFVVVTGRDLECWDGLHASVSRQLDQIRRLRLAQDFVTILGIFQKLPGVHLLAKHFLRLPIPLATAVLTNLGDVSRRHRRRYERDEQSPVIGGMRLLQVYAIPPLRPGTGLGVGLVLTAGRLSLSACMDRSVFGTESDNFFASLVQAWTDWIDENRNEHGTLTGSVKQRG